jgi:hypothetical protein
MKRKKKSLIDIRKWYRYEFLGTATVTLPKEKIVVDASIANISFSGIGLYSPAPIGKNKRVDMKISFINKDGKVCEDSMTGRVDWLSKLKNIYLLGIFFDEELNMINHPKLLGHLVWLIDTFNLPQPYKDKRISTL